MEKRLVTADVYVGENMKIYRGVGKTKFENDDKKLLVKGRRNQIELLAGSEEYYAGNDIFRIGATDQYNAAYLHNYDSQISNTAFISCTTNYVVAKKFATHEGYSDGYIFELSIPDEITNVIVIDDHNKAATNPHEFEVLLDLTNYDYTVPQEWIVNIEEITGNLT